MPLQLFLDFFSLTYSINLRSCMNIKLPKFNGINIQNFSPTYFIASNTQGHNFGTISRSWTNLTLTLIVCTSKLNLIVCRQGCTRPRPSPFWRPSTRCNGVLDPLRGGGRLQGFGPRGASIAVVSDFQAGSGQLYKNRVL